MSCHCGRSNEFNECCEPIINGTRLPKTAEDLMRARYSAYVVCDVAYLKKSLAPEERKDFDDQNVRQWSTQSKWLGLQILNSKNGNAEDKKGTVEFVVRYELDGKVLEHHEVSDFKRSSNTAPWFFCGGESHTHEDGKGHHDHSHEPVKREGPKLGRNDPCSCGSGKKFKKCCG